MTPNEIKSVKLSIDGDVVLSDGHNTSLVKDPSGGDFRFCSFCGTLVNPKFLNDEWVLECTCEDAKKIRDDVRDVQNQIQDLNRELDSLKKTQKTRAVKVWKSLYKNQIPNRNRTNELIDEEILNIDEEKIWDWKGDLSGS